MSKDIGRIVVYDEEDSGNFNYSDNQENLAEIDENESFCKSLFTRKKQQKTYKRNENIPEDTTKENTKIIDNRMGLICNFCDYTTTHSIKEHERTHTENSRNLQVLSKRIYIKKGSHAS